MRLVEIIAEIGTSHEGDPVKAMEMISAAHEAGADTVKFQWVIADEIIHPNTGNVPLPTGNIPLFQRFKSLEKGERFYRDLKDHAEKTGAGFLCTPFGPQSALGLMNIGSPRFKVASPELNHLPLLELLGASRKPLVVSSGVSRISDIEEALETINLARSGHFRYAPIFAPQVLSEILRNRDESIYHTDAPEFRSIKSGLSGLEQVSLLHCITSYPAPEDQYNLLLIPALSGIFGIPAGLSDHSLDPVMVPVLAAILGASAIEKHFTLSRNTEGLDDPIALEPAQFARMVKAVREVQTTNPDALPCQGPANRSWIILHCMTRLAELGYSYPETLVDSMLGSGIKTLADSERPNYGRTNRSMHALTDLEPGTVLGPHNMGILRTEKILRPGLHPRYADILTGKKIACHIPSGEGIRWQDIF